MTDVLEHLKLAGCGRTRQHAGRRVGLWRQWVEKLQSWRRIRATRRALDHLDDRMLKDIGISRCEITARAYRPSGDSERLWG